MNKDRLWAPWRRGYVGKKRKGKCIFCAAVSPSRKSYLLLVSRYSMAILNIYPYNNGHVMVAPRRHVKDLSLLSQAEALDLFSTIKKIKKALGRALRPHGYNIGANIGRSAGAGITGHLHIHIVPRWRGDANFMPAVFDTRVMSDSLGRLYDELIKYV